MMKKILPLTVAPIETYQATSFVLSIILSYENTSSAYFNNYINIQCNNTYNSYEMNLNFTDVTWEDYRIKGIAEMNLYYLNNIHRDTFVGFIKERIDQGNYLLFYRIDEYYLSYSEHFHKKHNIHDTYVYGYDSDFFCVMAYKGKKLSRINIPMLELLMAMYCQNNTMKDLSFCTFRPNHSIKEIMSLEMIKQYLSDYYHSEKSGSKSSTIVYGISVYNVLMRCVKNAISIFETKVSRMDLRPFRLFWEHKKVLKDHITKISDVVIIDNVIHEMIDEIESKAKNIFNLIIKYILNNDVHILERVVAYLSELKEKEEKLICLLLIALDSVP